MIPWCRFISTGGAILCYHSLTTPAIPSHSVVNVPLETFWDNVRSIRRVARVVPLRDLLARHRLGRSTRGLAALTFDDAYVAVAGLLLSKPHAGRIPLTIFVPTDFMEAGSRFWWDRLEDLCPEVSPSDWDDFERRVGLPEEYRLGHQGEGRLRAIRQWILAEFAGRLPEHVDRVLGQLETTSGIHTEHRAMTWQELEAVAQLPDVDLGVHTRTHPVLPLLPESEQMAEIQGSHAVMLERFPQTLPLLAIPFGLFDHRTGRIAAAAGMEAALTLGEALVRPEGDQTLLPRITANTGLRGWRVPLRLLGWFDSIVRRRRGLVGPYPALPSPAS